MNPANPLATALAARPGTARPVCQAGVGFIARGQLAGEIVRRIASEALATRARPGRD